MVDSGIRPVDPAVRAAKVEAKAEMADWAMPSDFMTASIGANEAMLAEEGGAKGSGWCGLGSTLETEQIRTIYGKHLWRGEMGGGRQQVIERESRRQRCTVHLSEKLRGGRAVSMTYERGVGTTFLDEGRRLFYSIEKERDVDMHSDVEWGK
jgi:hypothetical protein